MKVLSTQDMNAVNGGFFFVVVPTWMAVSAIATEIAVIGAIAANQ